MNQIKWHKKAKKQLKRIGNPIIQNKIYDAVEELRFFPKCQNVKKLTNRNDYRLRVGQYRVFFTVDLKIISIEEVKKRDERTY
jgi:mRNA-degrading endonuclease RelE of RelBE toxin-antitoxin system